MKTETLVIAAIEKGIRFEAYSNVETRQTFIGFNTVKHFWDWFVGQVSFCDDTENSRGWLNADHSYNQATGTTCKSWKKRSKLREKYTAMLGVETEMFDR